MRLKVGDRIFVNWPEINDGSYHARAVRQYGTISTGKLLGWVNAPKRELWVVYSTGSATLKLFQRTAASHNTKIQLVKGKKK